ncbi:hypothetical protein OWV82_018167 [Melia azedarach]|uniref:Uncharacterized protein n=1 Tax=Melia azedarach TaxID=155640 RepID=A0ACC1XBN6_MELAZ|nr:hypothetical protein OWV82_018167 [Melia azedarach]
MLRKWEEFKRSLLLPKLYGIYSHLMETNDQAPSWLHISTKIIVSSSLQKQELESSPSFGPSEKSIRIKHNMLERRGQAKSIYIKGLGKDKVVQRNRVMLPCICLGGRAERFWPGLCDQYFGGIYVDF